MTLAHPRRQQRADLRLVHRMQQPVAAQAAREGPGRARKVEPLEDLVQLRFGSQGTHVAAMADASPFEKFAIACQHDALLRLRQPLGLGVLEVVVVQRVEAGHAQQVGEPAQNLTAGAPEQLWSFYIQLTEVEQAFKELKHDLAVRPIFHRTEQRIEAHIFVAFLAYCLQVTLKARLKPLAGGITPREVLAKFKTMQMVDVHIPTTDGRELILSRYTQPEPEHRILLQGMRMQLPEQPPPTITASHVRRLVTEATAV